MTRKGHQGSRAREALATPDYSVQRPTAGGKKKKVFQTFFIILLISITLNIFHSNVLIFISGVTLPIVSLLLNSNLVFCF